MKTAVCPGSFDPITTGHLDLVERAAAIFDELIVCVSVNSAKPTGLFTPQERVELIEAVTADLPNVEAELWPGLLADFARLHGACAIVRGVRSVTDFDGEYQMAQINREICPGLETMLLPASAPYQHFSSSMAREMIRYRQPLERYLPAPIIPLVEQLTENEGGSHHGQ